MKVGTLPSAVVALLVGFSALPLAAQAVGDAEAGRRKAEPCSACHGSSGISVNDLWPNLAAQKAGYLVKQMRALRDGSRQDPIMTSLAKSLSDEDIRDLAAHYARMPPPGAADRDNWYRQRLEQKSY